MKEKTKTKKSSKPTDVKESKGSKAVTGSNVKATIQSKQFVDRLQFAEQVLKDMGGTEQKFLIHIDPKRSDLYAYSESVTIRLGLSDCLSEVSGSGNLSFDPQVLRGVFRNRANLSISLVKSNLHFKTSGKDKGYSGHTITMPVTDNMLESIKARAEWVAGDVKAANGGVQITDASFETLQEGVQATAITPCHDSQETYTFIRCGAGRVSVVSADRYHSAHYRSSKKIKELADFQLVVMFTYFLMFEKLRMLYALKKPPVLAIKDNKRVSLTCGEFTLTLPAVQADFNTLQQVEDTMGVLEKSQSLAFNFDGKSLSNSMGNLQSLYEKGRIIKVSEPIKGKGKEDPSTLRFQITSDYGEVTDNVAVDALTFTKSFKSENIDPMTFLDSLAKLMDKSGIGMSFHTSPQVYRLSHSLDNGIVTHVGGLLVE